MLRAIVCGVTIVLLAGDGYAVQGPSPQKDVIKQYCIGCHNEKLKTGGLVLENADVSKVGAGAPLWEKVVQKLRSGSMPPAGLPRPDAATYNSLATYLETELDRSAASSPGPGRPAVHRRDRAAYTNPVRHLPRMVPHALHFSP